MIGGMSESNGKSPLGALIPARCAVLVGEVELVLREPVLAKIDAAWQALDDEDLRQALTSVKEMLTSGQRKTDEAVKAVQVIVSTDLPEGAPLTSEDVSRAAVQTVERLSIADFMEVNFDRIVTVLRKGLMPLLTKKLADVIAIALDTRANRLSLAQDCPEVCDADLNARSLSPPGLATVSSAAFRAWVAEELTTNQAVYVLEKISEVSGWTDLGKRLWTLFAGSFPRMNPASLPEVSAT